MAKFNYVDVLDLIVEAEALSLACNTMLTPEFRQKVTPDARSMDDILTRLDRFTARVRTQF